MTREEVEAGGSPIAGANGPILAKLIVLAELDACIGLKLRLGRRSPSAATKKK